MAIFGSLDDMSLLELTPVLQKKRGRLDIQGVPGLKPVTMWLDKGLIQCVSHGMRPLTPLEARLAVLTTVGSSRGTFEFAPGSAAPPCSQPLGWNLIEVMHALPSSEPDTLVKLENLPGPETVFRLVPGANSEAGNGFYRQAAPYLQVGASSQSLAKQLNLPVDQVRYELAQMRALAMILPVQAYREEQAAPKPKGLIARLTGALFRRQREL